MKNKIVSLLVMLFVLLFTIDVKADWSPYMLEKENSNNNYYYDRLPTSVNKGDIITVKVSTLNARSNSKIADGTYVIEWDEKAFEIVENSGKYYTLKNNNIEVTYDMLEGDNSYHISFVGNDTIYANDYYTGTPLFELKFRVLNNAQDGVYNIYQTEGNGELYYDVDNDIYSYEPDVVRLGAYGIKLRYQVGKTKVVSDYTPDSIEPNSYVIGSHLFTYEGTRPLTTEHIMLAAKSIESDNMDDMIIYVKTARRTWKNAITNTDITPPEKFDIEYIDLVANYANNGLYSSNNDITVLALTQINDKQVIVTIEASEVIIHGIGTINGKVVTLNVSGKDYQITIGDNVATIETNDTNILDRNLTKKANYDVNDYYDDEYGNRYYLKSEASGKYVSGTKEIYFAQVYSKTYNVCIKEKNATKCAGRDNVYDDDIININGKQYHITKNNDGIVLTSNEDSAYVGTYTKESSITMDDMFALEENYIKYLVLFTDEDTSYGWEYVNHGDKIDFIPEKEGYRFVEWQLKGQTYDVNTPVTKPLALVAKWEAVIPTPVIGLGLTNNYYSRGIIFNNLEEYCSSSECYTPNTNIVNFSGYEVYEKIGNEYNLVDDVDELASYEITIEPNTVRTFAVRVYFENGGGKAYSDYSNDIVFDATIPTPVATFTETANDSVDYSSYNEGVYTYKIGVNNLTDFGYELNDNTGEWNDGYHTVDGLDLFEKVDNHLQPPVSLDINHPAEITISLGETKHYYVKAYVYVEGSKVYSELSNELVLVASIPTPEIAFAMGDDNYGHSIVIENRNDYCIGECNGTNSDQYIIDGYVIYEKNGSNYTTIKTNNSGALDDGSFVVNTFDESEDKTYVVKMFVKIAGEKIYSAYSNELVLHAAENEMACYLHDDSYVWGHFSGMEGYTKLNNIISEVDCRPPELIYQCYLDSDNNEYHWTAAPNVTWALVTDIESESECHF